jgi:predicted Zn-dependent protease
MTTTQDRTAGAITLSPDAIAERVLEVVRGKTGDAEAEVLVRTGRSALTRFANSFVHQNVGEDVSSVRLRVALDGRVAVSELEGSTAGEALARLVDDALEAARVRPVDPDWPGLAPTEPAPDVEHWDEPTAFASPTERARHVRAFVDAADGLATAGYCSTDGFDVAFANSAGQRLGGRGSVAIQQASRGPRHPTAGRGSRTSPWRRWTRALSVGSRARRPARAPSRRTSSPVPTR